MRAPRSVSSNARTSAAWPSHRKNSTSTEVSRASQTHQVPHMGLPQKAPVHSDKKAINAPVGARAWAIMLERRALSESPIAAHPAMTK